MARFRADEADNYGGNGGAGFFSLANDGDCARVRFMYNTIDDVEGVSVHEVEVNGKNRFVNCLREYNDPIDKCPFCRDRIPVKAKVFVPVYVVDEDAVKIWQRGKKFFSKLSSLCARYNPLVSKEFEVERNGKKGDTQTDYQLYPMDDGEDLVMEDLPEIPENKLVLDKSADDMEYFLEEGEFPPEEDDAPRRRGREGRRGSSERNSARRGRASRDDADDDEGFTNIPDGIDDEVPFGDGEETPRRSRRDSGRGDSRQSGRRTPASGRRRSNTDEY